MDACFSSLKSARNQCIVLLITTSVPVILYIGIVINDIHSLKNDCPGTEQRFLPCPVGYLPCDTTANDSHQCLEERFWCDSNKDCRNGQDEDEFSCYEKFSYVQVPCIEEFFDSPHTIANCSQAKLSATNCTCILSTTSTIDCSGLGLTELPGPNLLNTSASSLLLTENNLTEIVMVGYNSLSHLSILNISYNQLTELKPSAFASLVELKTFIATGNLLTVIHPGAFHGLAKLSNVYLERNRLRYLPAGAFDGIRSLCMLLLQWNELTLSSSDVLPSSAIIELQHNRIRQVDEVFLEHLRGIRLLNLAHNSISQVSERAFQRAARQLTDLDLSYNELTQLPIIQAEINYSTSLSFLSLANNPISIFEADFFAGLVRLHTLNLSGLRLGVINTQLFQPLTELDVIEFDSFEMCRYAPMVSICHPRGDGISSVANLLEIQLLRVSIWFIAVTICAGNVFVLVCRMLFSEEKNVHSLFIKNLAAADFMMGIYLLSVATHDVLYRDQYNRYALMWTSSWSCSATGVVAMVSSEVSVFILATVSVDCCLAVSRPYRPPLLTTRRAVCVLGGLWLTGICLAVLPFALDVQFYGSNGVCMPLHIHDPYHPGWQYSAFVFLGINSVAVVAIAVSYGVIAASVRRSRRARCHEGGGGAYETSTGNLIANDQDRSMAKRFFVIVLTDLMCWVPIVFIKIMALSNLHISDQLYAWLTVFVMPINSALNPLLYTFTTPSFVRKLRQHSNVKLKILNSFPFNLANRRRWSHASRTTTTMTTTMTTNLLQVDSTTAVDVHRRSPTVVQQISTTSSTNVDEQQLLLPPSGGSTAVLVEQTCFRVVVDEVELCDMIVPLADCECLSTNYDIT